MSFLQGGRQGHLWAGCNLGWEEWVAEQRGAVSGLHLHLQGSIVRDGCTWVGRSGRCAERGTGKTAPTGRWWLHLPPRRQQQQEQQRAASQARPRWATCAVRQLQQTSTCKQAVAAPPRTATAAAEGSGPGQAKVAENVLSCSRCQYDLGDVLLVHAAAVSIPVNPREVV